MILNFDTGIGWHNQTLVEIGLLFIEYSKIDFVAEKILTPL
jgi:hypothetical protein